MGAQAGLLSSTEILAALKRMQANVASVAAAGGSVTIGLTMYPPYPNITGLNLMAEYTYQNGGDWTWFGGRMVQALVQHGFLAEAAAALGPMTARVIEHNGFFEWWGHDGKPQGSNQFHGSAGVLG